MRIFNFIVRHYKFIVQLFIYSYFVIFFSFKIANTVEYDFKFYVRIFVVALFAGYAFFITRSFIKENK